MMISIDRRLYYSFTSLNAMFINGRQDLIRMSSIDISFFFVNVFSAERDYVVQEDFMKAVRKLAENKKLEGKLDYEKV